LQNPSNVTHRFQSLLEQHGLPRWRFHDLRHATASVLPANGANLAEVQKVLHHSRYALMANLYADLTPELAERNAD
jgi:integrase